MNLRNSLKNFYISSKIIPRIYTFLSKPFETSLRHLENPKELKENFSVSVVVPNYNYANFLDKRLATILSQTYNISELIILDDASTDNSEEKIQTWLEKIAKNYPKIKVSYEKNPKNSGKAIIQWQKAFKKASGDFIWIAEADDFSDKNFLSVAMSAFDDEKVVLSYTNSVAINKTGSVLSYDFINHAGKLNKSHFKKSYINDGKKEIKEVLSHRCTIPNVSAVVFRKKKDIPFEKYLKEAEKYTQVGDWYFYLKVLSHGKIAFSKQSLNFFRLSGSSVTSKSRNSKKHLEEIEEIKSIFEEKNG